MSKRTHTDMTEGGAALIGTVQRQRSARMAQQMMMLVMVFSLINFSTILMTDSKYGGNKTFEMSRERVNFDETIASAYTDGDFRRVYRMSKDTFNDLHNILLPRLLQIFFPSGGGTRDPSKSKYLIDTKVRLSIAMRFFAGADPLDLFGWHGVSLVSVFISVWGVIDAVNSTPSLAFGFPDADGQRMIAEGFLAKSGAGFDNVIGAIDGILIWTRMPSLAMAEYVNVGQSNFRCHRKDKYGMNMQAICDRMLRFLWIDINWPGSSSDYMAWVTSPLYHNLVSGAQKILEGMTLIGDCAYIKKPFMATPLKGTRRGYEDAYNYFHSQLRTTIERAFGVLVHRFAILRSPLSIPLPKVGPLVMCLCRLHNFCIDHNENNCDGVDGGNWNHLNSEVRRYQEEEGGSSGVVQLSRAGGRPSALLDNCHHFIDAERHRQGGDDVDTPMDAMLASVRDQNLRRPSPRS